MTDDKSRDQTDEVRSYYSLTMRVFNALAPYYDLFNIFLVGVRKKTVNIAHVGFGSMVLDIACGTGKQAFAFAEEGCNVTGIDITQAMLDVAVRKNRYPNLKFVAGDATQLPYGDESFDVTTISFALHDMPLPIRESVLGEMVRVTKKEGRVIVVDYALPKNRVGRFIIYHLIKLYEGEYYVKFIHSDLEALLEKSRIGITERHGALLGAVKILAGRRT